MTLYAAPAAGVNYIPICALGMDADYTMTLRAADGTFLGNTGLADPPFSLHSYEWIFFQLNIAVAGNPVTFDCELAVDGTSMFTGVAVPSGVSATPMIGGDPSFGGVSLTGPGISNFAQMVIADPVAVPSWPAPGIAPKLRMTQALIEHGGLPLTAQVRLSQMPLEYARVPNSARIRLSQMVIEWAHLDTPLVGGWQLYEA